jgi:predicted RNA-binding protein associated with RNAse of E/G family
LNRKKVKNNTILPNTYNKELPITTEKKRSSVIIITIDTKVFHQYYINLKTKTGMNDPIISDDED